MPSCLHLGTRVPDLSEDFFTDTPCVQIAKGLVVRSDERGFSLVERILALFSDAELGPDAAAALGVIAEDNDRVLSKENFAVIRVSPRGIDGPSVRTAR